jgi:hypothetical protein
MCKHPETFSAKSRERADGCIYSCRVAVPDGGKDDWCAVCWKQRQRPTSVAGCQLRQDILRARSSSVLDGAQTPITAGGARARTRSVLLAAASGGVLGGGDGAPEATDDEAAAGGDGGPVARKRLTLDDLDTDRAPEHIILSKASVVVVIVTANARVSQSQRGRLLRDAIAQRGVRRDHFDEIDTVHSHSMASYNPDITCVGRARNTLAARLAGRGLARPQRIASCCGRRACNHPLGRMLDHRHRLRRGGCKILGVASCARARAAAPRLLRP